MRELTVAEKEIEKQGWWRGVIYAVADVYRGHGCSVSAKETLETLGQELHAACRISCEYDVQPLRKVINDLPFGDDADYSNLRIEPVDMEGDVCSEEDAFEFEVRGDYGGEVVVISCFDEKSEANAFLTANTDSMLSGAGVSDD